MAVLYLIPNLAPCGDSAQLELLLRSFDDMGPNCGLNGEIHIFTFSPLGNGERRRFEEGFQWLSVQIHLIRPYFSADIFFQILRVIYGSRICPQIVHIWGDRPAGIGLRISQFFKAVSILSLRRIPSQYPPGKSTVRAFDYLMINSAALQKYWEKQGYRGNWIIVRDQPAAPRKALVPTSASPRPTNAYEAETPSETPRVPQNKSEFLAELGLPENSVLAVCAGPVESWKRWQWAIWSIDSIVRVHPEIHLLFLDPELNVPHLRKQDATRELERRNIARFAKQYERESIVHFIPRRNDLAAILPFMDYFWNPQSVPGSGLALLEAAAVGVPIISADFEGLDELLPDGTCARVPAFHETTAIAAATHNLWDQSEKKQEMNAKSAENLKIFFNSNSYAEIYLNIYRK